MPKRKGLGRDVNKSLEIMTELRNSLKKFSDMPLKRGLEGVLDEDLSKKIDDATEKAIPLINQLDNLCKTVKTIKTDKNSRFGSLSRRVVEQFLSEQIF